VGGGDNAVHFSIALFSVFDSIRILPCKKLESIGAMEEWNSRGGWKVEK